MRYIQNRDSFFTFFLYGRFVCRLNGMILFYYAHAQSANNILVFILPFYLINLFIVFVCIIFTRYSINKKEIHRMCSFMGILLLLIVIFTFICFILKIQFYQNHEFIYLSVCAYFDTFCLFFLSQCLFHCHITQMKSKIVFMHNF